MKIMTKATLSRISHYNLDRAYSKTPSLLTLTVPPTWATFFAVSVHQGQLRRTCFSETRWLDGVAEIVRVTF